MKKKLFIYLTLIFLALSSGCDKEENADIIFTGTVQGESNDCQGSNRSGKPFIIKMDNDVPYELIYTLTLPTEFKIIGKKVGLKARRITDKDEALLCNTQVIGVKQMVIFDVK